MDMLVKLYDPALADPAGRQVEGVRIRRAMAYEKEPVVAWVRDHFAESAPGWPSETGVCFANAPVSCYIATAAGELRGFAAYNSTAKGLFGPTGVAEPFRRRGIGRALLLSSLHAMWMEGYAYAVIGGVGSTAFYAKAAGAIEIPGSEPGIYRDPLTAPLR